MKASSILSATLLATTIMTAMPAQTVVFAAERPGAIVQVKKEEEELTSDYAYIMGTSLGMSLSSGRANYSLTIYGISGVTGVKGWVRLYKQSSSGSYSEVDSVYIDKNGSTLRYSGVLSTAGSGNYRITFNGRVYAGSKSEAVSLSKTGSY